MYFLALSQAPPALDMNTAMAKPVTDTPPSRPNNTRGPEDQAGDDGNDNGQQSGNDHLVQSTFGAQVNAGVVVGIGLAGH
jgi:hypothetical protein